jgi:hypothetical protein
LFNFKAAIGFPSIVSLHYTATRKVLPQRQLFPSIQFPVIEYNILFSFFFCPHVVAPSQSMLELLIVPTDANNQFLVNLIFLLIITGFQMLYF